MDTIKGFLGVNTVRVGDVNRGVTHQVPPPLVCRDRVANPPSPPPNPLAGIEITPEYEKILALIQAGYPLIFVTGKAGTGKSTLIRYLRTVTKKNIVVVAPTGVAAINIKGTTIHSFFRLPPRIVSEDDVKEMADRMLYNKLDILIVDEVSMVRADLLDAMDKFLRVNGRDSSRPFGGVQVLLIGDLFQLPPVVTRQDWKILSEMQYGSPFFFSSRCLQANHMAPVELTRIFRQADPAFAKLLNQIRISANVREAVQLVNQACFPATSNPAPLITLTCTNAKADTVNITRLRSLTGAERTYIGETSGSFTFEDDKRPDKLPSPYKLTVKIGAQVMFTKNDDQKRWVNGTLGTVKQMDDQRMQIELMTEHPGLIHDVQRVSWESFRYRYDRRRGQIVAEVTGQYTQFPLMLAWAVTIHKSQGKTLERVEIDLGDGAFSPGQVYVALSRCRKLTDISLTRPIAPEEVKCDERIKCFYEILEAAKTATPVGHTNRSE
jgi:hypothetical protein